MKQFTVGIIYTLFPLVVFCQQSTPSIDYKIGDTCYGGILFNIQSYRGSIYALIAAPYDQANKMSWGDNGITGATSSSDGQFNTRNIINFDFKYYSDYYCAAVKCYQCRIGGYDDWYLPSVDELSLMYSNRDQIGGFLLGDYCSSTEFGNKDAYCIHFRPSRRTVFYYNKRDELYNVRCIRKQKISTDIENTSYSVNEIQKYLITTSTLDQIEGIYNVTQSGGLLYYKIGIIRDSSAFKGIIIESNSANWKLGDIKAIFEPSSIDGLYSTKWYTEKRVPYHTFSIIENKALLIVEFLDPKTGEKIQEKLIKMYPPVSGDFTTEKPIEGSSGSGFFITKDGIIATNAHVVQNCKNIDVFVFNEEGSFSYKAQILLVDKTNDVALIKIKDNRFTDLKEVPYGICDKVNVGDPVFTLGYPLTDYMGTNCKLTDGIISALTGSEDDVRYYQITVPLQPGNSGGPLFNKDGNIIALTSSRFNSKVVATNVENVNYAIKSSFLENLLNLIPSFSGLSSTSQLQGRDIQDQVKVLKKYVCLIKVYR
jgi:S1-C subfamily serine protease